MADKFIEVPSNLEDVTILKRFLNELVDKLNGNALVSYPISYPSGYTGPVPYNYSTLVGGYTNTILEAAARADAISGDAKAYITGNLTTNVLQNTKDLATITEQFGTFYNDATAAAWYGLTVKSGELISGFTVSGVDSDTTTPGTAGSVFAISADTFTVGRAIEDINDPAELAYIAANGLPYGTMYDTVNDEIIPAFLIEWNGTGYDIFFNGKTEFNSYLSPGTTTIDGGKIKTGSITTDQIAANTITTNDIALGTGLINGYVQSSDFTAIGGAGFRLKSNAVSTYEDPDIYGAYIRGGRIKGTTIEGATLIGQVLSVNNMVVNNSSYPSNTSNFIIYGSSSASVTGYSTTIYGTTVMLISASYGSGFSPNRIVVSNNLFTFDYNMSSKTDYFSAAIECSVDGGTYYSLVTLSKSGGTSANSKSGRLNVSIPFSSTILFRARATAGAENGTTVCAFTVNLFNFNHL